ncbi:lysosomal proton-coupled steroid conjugate and bile acid symporter SLC46A3 [Procambarus clarkii]|uniref:lysosomal proton-coupled steroid conjugate and bile acid symporter SLC46A3 n=1 Tax=Procambarus clarkii TaxID=6728 RepID=UPI0037445773
MMSEHGGCEYGNLLEQRPPTKSLRAKLATFLASITVEPAMFLHGLGSSIESIFYTNLCVDKVCLNYYKYGKDVCGNLDSGSYESQQDAVQRMVSTFEVYKHWVEYMPAIFVVLFLGIYSDTRGRRLPILLPFCGSLIKALFLVANSYWWSWPLPMLIVSFFPYGISGGMIGSLAGAYSYVSDASVDKSRTTRLAITGAMSLVAMSLGKVSGTFIYSKGGYIAIFSTQAIFYAASILYIILRLKEHPSGCSPETMDSRKELKQRLLSITTVKRTLMVVFKRREAGGRGFIIGHIAAICSRVFTAGSLQMFFLYMRKRFDWNYYTYNMYSILTIPVLFIGNFILLPVLSYRFKVKDAMLGFIGGISSLFHNVMLGTAPYAWIVYLASAVSLCSFMSILSSRGALSKLVAKDELGSTFAVLALGETLIPLVSTPVYTLIYNNTLDIFPGAIFLLTSGFDIACCCIYVWMLTREVPLSGYTAIA